VIVEIASTAGTEGRTVRVHAALLSVTAKETGGVEAVLFP
jgi:hypothetical protein